MQKLDHGKKKLVCRKCGYELDDQAEVVGFSVICPRCRRPL